ncbi:MAG: hypothetical protein D6765_15780, partial [Bacteroidetes bacterium]
AGHLRLLVPDNPAALLVVDLVQGQVRGRRTLALAGPSDESIRTLLVESDSTVLVGTSRRLLRCHTNGSVTETLAWFAPAKVVALQAVDEHTLLVATDTAGIFFFDKRGKKATGTLQWKSGGTVRPFRRPIERMTLTPDGTVWVSVQGEGVYFTNLRKPKFRTALQPRNGTGMGGSFVRGLCRDSRGRMWVLTRGGVWVLNADFEPLPGFDAYRGAGRPPGGEPLDIHCDDQDQIWVCTNAGLFCLRDSGGRFERVSAPGLRMEGVSRVAPLPGGRHLLVASFADGLFVVDPQAAEFRRRSLPGWDSGGYSMTYTAPSGRVWLHHQQTRLLGCRWTGSTLQEEWEVPFGSLITGLAESPGGDSLWIASDAGLHLLLLQPDTPRLQPVPQLAHAGLAGLLLDAAGRLWLSSNKGLWRYDPPSGELLQYDEADGLQGLEFNFWAAEAPFPGCFVFGGVSGLNFFNPLELEARTPPARPVITSILLNDVLPPGPFTRTEATAPSAIRALHLPYRYNTLSVHFAALEFSQPAACRFRYRMEGLDEDWVEAGTHNFARYPNLREGRYRFLVDATNSDGRWSGRPAVLELSVAPPWWRTPLFYLGCLLLVGTLAYGAYRIRIAQIRKEAAFKLRQAETQTAILRLQMNPHFLFNSMNSINSYLLKKDVATASDYLGRFARLMRKILKFAAKDYISVSEEIEILEEYLRTEMMRFEKKFEFEFDLDENLDPDEVLLPTMLLQPFVENAVWHGLTRKEGMGRIRIRFGIDNGQLVCEVEDNGVGRARAQAGGKKHESRALDITRSRLQLLEERHGKPAELQIEDLMKDGQPAGTRVRVRLPLL